MKQLLREIITAVNLFLASDKYVAIPIFVAITSVVLILTAYLLSYPNLPAKLPLFYSHPWGESQLAPKIQFLAIPGVILAVTAINSVIAWQLHPSQLVLKRSLMLSLVLINGILCLTALKIIGIFL